SNRLLEKDASIAVLKLLRDLESDAFHFHQSSDRDAYHNHDKRGSVPAQMEEGDDALVSCRAESIHEYQLQALLEASCSAHARAVHVEACSTPELVHTPAL